MPRKLGMGTAFLTFLLLAGTWPGLGQQSQKINLKVLLPQADAKLSVDKKSVGGTGAERQVEVSTDKDNITITASWDPNGYTTFMRTRKVSAKTKGDLVVDLRADDPKNPDDIKVIYVPTPDDVVEEMCKLGKVNQSDVVYDLGCGDGRMVITAITKFGAKRGVGVDLDPERVKDSKENAKKNDVESKVEFRQGDVLKVEDLSDASVVLLYMGDFINLRLRPILKKTLKPGSRVVSHRFEMGDWTPTKSIKYKGKNGYDYDLHLWVIGENK